MSRAAWVLLVSGILGFRVGIAGFPTWAIPVESAQAVAGLVTFPADNPFYIYHTRVWTLLVVQVCAVLLRAGVSEITLSRAISGLLGMVSFQALAMFVFAISLDALLSIGAAFVIFFSRITDAGVVYPVMLLDTHHTYGALGLSLVVLVLALFGGGWHRTAAFLLGLLPAVHPSLGVWTAVVAAASLAWERWERPAEGAGPVREAAKYFLAGALITLVSLTVQLTMIARSADVDAAVAATYFEAFVRNWDEHRRPVHLLQPGVIVNAGALALGCFWLARFRADVPPPARFLLRTVIASAVIGLAAIGFTWIPADNQPRLLSLLMPARILNYNVMVIGPLIIGLLGAWRGGFWSQLLIAGYLMGLLLNGRSMFEPHPIDPTYVLVAGIVAAGLLGAMRVLRHTGPLGMRPAPPAAIARVFCLALSLAAAALTLGVSRSPALYRDRTNDPFFAAVSAETRGVVLTAGSYQLVQLYTRRPVLMDGGGLDTIAYAPDTGPAMERILRDVYGIDYFNPPAWAKGSSLLPHDHVKRVWGAFSLEKWIEIGRAYGVTQVLARDDYDLRLPLVAREGSFRLYRVPLSPAPDLVKMVE